MSAAFESAPLFAAWPVFRSGFPVWLAALLGVLAAAGVGFLYAREAGRVPGWRRAVLAGLRSLALVSVLVLALRPALQTETSGLRPKPVAVLVDDTQSMKTADPRPGMADRWRAAVALDLLPPDKPVPENPSAGDVPDRTPERPTRLELAKAVLTNPRLDLLNKLAAAGPVQPATVGASRSARDGRSAAWVQSLTGGEARTALVDCIADVLKRDENELPTAIVVVTDGRDNASQRTFDDLGRECARLKVPLHIYGVGSSSFGQVQVRDAIAPETLFVDDTVSVGVRYRVRGVREGKAEITVKLNGREVARKEVAVGDGGDRTDAVTFVPLQADAKPGKQELTTSVRLLTGPEGVQDDLTKSVRVVDRKLKVLVADSLPRWDFKYLQRALLRDRRVDARFFLTEGDRRALESGPPYVPKLPETRAELFAYDLLVLGDFPARSLSPEQQAFVREFVAEGGGLIHIAGRNHGPASFADTPLADVLPVEFQAETLPIDAGRPPAGFRPELTPVGVRTSLMSLADDPVESLRVWRTLPELFWAYPVTKLKPASEAYLVHPTKTTADGKPMPLVAAHYYGKGYCLYCGFDETWRWRFNEADKYFGRFWSQAVYVVGVPRTLGTKLTQLSLDTPDPQLGKTGQVYARLLTPNLRPVAADEVEATLERTDAGPGDKDRIARVKLRKLPGQTGDFVATVPFNQAGRFTLTVDNGGNPGTLEYRVVLPPDHELSPGGMAEDDLRALAAASGGKFYREEDLHTLPAAVTRKVVPYTQREEVLLWNEWALLWVVGLLAAEWFLRKFNSLS